MYNLIIQNNFLLKANEFLAFAHTYATTTFLIKPISWNL